MIELLNVISTELTNLGINYDYGSWKQIPIPYPYVVGKYFPSDYKNENHITEGEFMLEAWDRNNSFSRLVELDNKIKNHFRDFRTVKDKTGMQISYFISSLEEQDDAELKKIQIRLDFSYWEGE